MGGSERLASRGCSGHAERSPRTAQEMVAAILGEQRGGMGRTGHVTMSCGRLSGRARSSYRLPRSTCGRGRGPCGSCKEGPRHTSVSAVVVLQMSALVKPLAVLT